MAATAPHTTTQAPRRQRQLVDAIAGDPDRRQHGPVGAKRRVAGAVQQRRRLHEQRRAQFCRVRSAVTWRGPATSRTRPAGRSTRTSRRPVLQRPGKPRLDQLQRKGQQRNRVGVADRLYRRVVPDADDVRRGGHCHGSRPEVTKGQHVGLGVVPHRPVRGWSAGHAGHARPGRTSRRRRPRRAARSCDLADRHGDDRRGFDRQPPDTVP